MPDSRQRFSAVAAAYHRFRPTYPAAALDWILATTAAQPGARAADLGCGTGIFSRLLAARGLRVTGVEPNPEMLALAREAGGGPTYVAGEAARTGLADASVDLVTAAQAFHWFPLEATLAELARILVPGGWTAAVWNLRVSSPFVDEYEELLERYSSEYAANRALSDLHHDPRSRIAGLPGTVTTQVPNDQMLPWDEVIGRVRSASYVAHGVADKGGFERAVREAHERHRSGEGKVLWAMRTVVIAWTGSPPAPAAMG
ncbi:MAG TPA: class I SAM-dependent methyltransferase [Kofleriaceae bacterium]|nr:class I SAM-dependent methyltransferase [Kofleriaceae bacterium]